MAKILFIMTGTDKWSLADGTVHPTGFWADEATGPLEAFKAAGHEVAIATPGGVTSPVDRASLSADANGGEERAEHVRSVAKNAVEFGAAIGLARVKISDYDAVFVPGGHGPMEDLANNPASGDLLADALAAGKPIGVVCHGPAALLAATGPGGANAFTGYRVTAFSNEEERLGGLAERAKWLLEDRLTERGISVEVGEPFEPHVEVDRNLVTGQNPASARPVAEELLKRLG